MKNKKIVAIAIAVALLAAVVFAAVAYTARLEEYAAVYVMLDDTGVQVHFRALNPEAARRKAQRKTPPGSTFLTVFEWTPPYPPPSTFAVEGATGNDCEQDQD
jgi:ABC-type oligopeptide transport system substrate-binding subunit